MSHEHHRVPLHPGWVDLLVALPVVALLATIAFVLST